MRINRYLALQGYASRREADEFLKRGLVKINGRTARVGEDVGEKDIVTIDEQAKKIKKLVYLAYYKPLGVVTHSPEGDQKSVKEALNYPIPVSPVGRLDRASEGLLILTNDGRVTGRLLEPSRGNEKEYIVRVEKPVTSWFLKRMAEGVRLEDGTIAKPKKITEIGGSSFILILTEGKRHEIRRMCALLGYVVESLKRVRVMNIKLGSLKPGMYRELKGKELKDFITGLGL